MRKQKRKKGKGSALAICIFMFLTTLLSFLNRVYDRKQAIRAVNEDEHLKVIIRNSTKEKL